jgi:type II secretory pathway pseudopilin PulG
LVIVITIMAILLVLGVVNLRGSQANGRDAERKTDIESIAQHLETYYTSGTDGSTDVGGYPSTSITSSQNTMTTVLRDIDTDSLMAPGISDPTQTFIPATCSGTCLQTTAGVTPQPTINQYVYQPLHSDGTLCNDAVECRKFNLYYRLEADNSVNMVTSLNQ